MGATSVPILVPVEGMEVSLEEFERIALDDDDRPWELHDGRLQEKQSADYRHNDAMFLIRLFIGQHIDLTRYGVRVNAGHVRRGNKRVYIPDVMVLPIADAAAFIDRDDVLEVYQDPLPFVVEVWSRSTGDTDLREKIPTYMQRGDREIWRLHPFRRTLRFWRRREDGDYDEEDVTGGTVELHALPGVRIDLDRLFALVAHHPTA